MSRHFNISRNEIVEISTGLLVVYDSPWCLCLVKLSCQE